MLVRIKPENVEIGMFVHAFEGSWLDHPFWRSKFRIETREDLQRIRSSAIDGLVIDKAKSRMAADDRPRDEVTGRPIQFVTKPTAPRSAATKVAAAQPFLAPQREPDRTRRGYSGECRRAKRVIERSHKAVSDMFDNARLGRAVEARKMVPLAKSVADSIERDAKALINLVRLKAKDEYTYLHSVAVCALMINFARHLHLDEDVVQDLGVAGLLHDVGKVAIADNILNKAGGLSEHERHSVRGHPDAGHQLLTNSPDVPEAALEVCRHHHEKVDGGGYPLGLKGEELSLFARMGAICDVYDAVTSNRPYKDAWTPCDALTEMQQWKGHFDPRLLEQFADSLGIYPIGSLVRLSSGELGVVTGSDGVTGENVVVRVFFDCELLSECELVDRAIPPSAEHPRIVSRDSPTFWRFDDWDAMRHRILAASPDGKPKG